MNDRRFSCGLFIGRFQPFHKGHFHVVNYALNRCDKLIIGLGSTNVIDINNPIDAKTRDVIIRKSITEWGIDIKKITIVYINDYPDNDDLWFENIVNVCPKFDVLFSGNDYVIKVLTDHGIEVIKPTSLSRKSLSGTMIREKIRSGEEIMDDIADSAKELIYSKIKKNLE